MAAQCRQGIIELIHDGENFTCIYIRQPAGHDHGPFIDGDKAAHQMFGQQADIFLQGLHARVTGLLQPAAERFQRPDIAQPGLFLNHAMSRRDSRQNFG